jgi:hypothetical protein
MWDEVPPGPQSCFFLVGYGWIIGIPWYPTTNKDISLKNNMSKLVFHEQFINPKQSKHSF